MATEYETFKDIDWENKSVSTSGLSRVGLAELGAYVLMLALIGYDHYVSGSHVLATHYNITIVDWMFVATLIALFFHLAYPLYRNTRMRRFYWKRFKKNRVAVVALCYLAFIFVVGLIGPMLISKPEVQFANRIVPPVGVTATVEGAVKTGTWKYPLGTTAKGRGIFKLVIYGMRVSMEVGLISTVFTVLIGSIVGALGALATSLDIGWMDEVLMRYVDIQGTFPTFMLLLLLIYLFGAHLWMIILLYGFFSWEGVARSVRGEALQRAEEDYVTAARASGANMLYILRQHLIPNSANSVIINATVAIPGFILGYAALAYLGFSDPSTFSWGQTISAGKGFLDTAWWISTIPGIFLFLTVLSFYYIGESLRDAMDPRQDVEGGGGV